MPRSTGTKRSIGDVGNFGFIAFPRTAHIVQEILVGRREERHKAGNNEWNSQSGPKFRNALGILGPHSTLLLSVTAGLLLSRLVTCWWGGGVRKRSIGYLESAGSQRRKPRPHK
eukprot:GHVT01035478.1.p1 GENE.GHVT01035478.1~~GHVT01035478.1.p1  ORF type:complete len:114 (-),score=10.20 GHVT01035478.1:53-394(-)